MALQKPTDLFGGLRMICLERAEAWWRCCSCRAGLSPPYILVINIHKIAKWSGNSSFVELRRMDLRFQEDQGAQHFLSILLIPLTLLYLITIVYNIVYINFLRRVSTFFNDTLDPLEPNYHDIKY
jgi:hypothetical protein